MDHDSVRQVPPAWQVGAAAGLLMALAGCASHGVPSGPALSPPAAYEAQAVQPDIYAAESSDNAIDAVRTGRYQLLTLDPSAGQRNLLRQTVEIDLPASMQLTVADGLAHALRGSGLRLCAGAAGPVFSGPLPAVHRELGPTMLGDALQVLAGPAWRLYVDFAARTVCFDPRTPNAAAHRSPDSQEGSDHA